MQSWGSSYQKKKTCRPTNTENLSYILNVSSLKYLATIALIQFLNLLLSFFKVFISATVRMMYFVFGNVTSCFSNMRILAVPGRRHRRLVTNSLAWSRTVDDLYVLKGCVKKITLQCYFSPQIDCLQRSSKQTKECLAIVASHRV